MPSTRVFALEGAQCLLLMLRFVHHWDLWIKELGSKTLLICWRINEGWNINVRELFAHISHWVTTIHVCSGHSVVQDYFRVGLCVVHGGEPQFTIALFALVSLIFHFHFFTPFFPHGWILFCNTLFCIPILGLQALYI